MYQGSNELVAMRNWILLDNGSTTDIFCNPGLLVNIVETRDIMMIITNAGCFSTKMNGALGNYGAVWYSPRAITNVLSLKNISDKYRVIYHSWGTGSFEVHKPNSIIRFMQNSAGLYVHNTNNNEIVLLNTVSSKREGYSNHNYCAMVKACHKYEMIRYPSIKDYKNMVEHYLLGDTGITLWGITNADNIFGASMPALKGKDVCKTPNPVVADYIYVLESILEWYKNIELFVDIMFINNLPILIMISRHLKFMTVDVLDDRSACKIMVSLQETNELYWRRGFNITACYLDPEFKAIKKIKSKITVLINMTATKEHMPEVERQIRVIKERYMQYVILCHTLSYQN